MVPTPDRPPIRVSLAAPDLLSLTGLRSYFTAQAGVVVLADQEQQQRDVLVVAVDGLGPAMLTTLREAAAQAEKPVVLIAGRLSEAELPAALRCGVTVVLLRDAADGDRVRQSVRIAASGGGFLPPRLFGVLIQHLEQLDRATATGRRPSANRPAGREIEILRLLADGRDSADIAETLGYSERTVKGVFQKIARRYDLRNRPHAVAYALRSGWI